MTGRPYAATIPSRWLTVVRLVWLAAAGIGIGLFVASVPTVYDLQLQFTANPTVQKNLSEVGLTSAPYAFLQTAFQISFGAVCCAVAVIIFWRKSDEVMALFVALLLITFGAAPSTPWIQTLSPLWAVPATALRFFGFASVAAFFFLFPDGRFVPRWTRWLALYWPLLPVLLIVFPAPPAPLRIFFLVLYPLSLAGMLGAFAYAQIYRYRRVSGPVERQQTKWLIFGVMGVVVPGILGLLLSLIFPAMLEAGTLIHLGGSIVVQCAALLIPLSLGIAILRYRLWAVDPIINRTLIYGALTASIVGIYVVVVGGLGTLLQARGNLALSLLATGLIAVLFQPLHQRLQRTVNRLMYGERDDPYAVIARLGQRLETTLAPDAVLPMIVDTVREALKLPYAAITLAANDERAAPQLIPARDAAAPGAPFMIVAAAGTPVSDPLRVPLVYQGEPVGHLLLGPRAAGEPWSRADQRLLADFARQAGVAVHAVRLTTELQHARARLVTAREEERRRLRRDLHDGLGPALGSLALQADTARDLVQCDPAEAEALLADMTTQAQAAVTDIRRLVYNLRPPALDDLGLVAALRAQAAHYEHGGLQIAVDAPDQLPPLLAAVEVAAYRIVQEALTNVVRHAEAHRCTVRLAVDGALDLVIIDDGRGLPPDRRAGVGLASMRERAAELGGACSIEPGPDGGTRVHARLPLA